MITESGIFRKGPTFAKTATTGQLNTQRRMLEVKGLERNLLRGD